MELKEKLSIKEQQEIRNLHAEQKKKFLPNKEVWLKPVPGKDLTMIKADKNFSAHSFMYEGAIVEKWLTMDDRGNYFDPFDSEEEREFFEKETGRNLSLNWRDTTCAWNTSKDGIKLRFNADEKFKKFGYRFNLNNVYDNLAYKVARRQRDIAHSLKEAKEKSHFVFYLSDGAEENNQKRDEFNMNSKIYMEFGSMQNSKDKMKEFLELYYVTNKEPKEVPEGVSDDALKNEIQTLIDNFPTKVVNVLNDEDKEIKIFMLKGIKAGAIEKSGIDTFNLPGGSKYNLNEFLGFLKLLEKKKDTDDSYGKILHRIQIYEEG